MPTRIKTTINATKVMDTVLFPSQSPGKPTSQKPYIVTLVIPTSQTYQGISVEDGSPIVWPPGTPVDLLPPAPGIPIFMFAVGGAAALATISTAIGSAIFRGDASTASALRETLAEATEIKARLDANGGKFPIPPAPTSVVRRTQFPPRIIFRPRTTPSTPSQTIPSPPPPPAQTPQEEVIFQLTVVGDEQATNELQQRVLSIVGDQDLSATEILNIAEDVLEEIRLRQFGST